MRDMGDVSADVWAEELRRTGRVVFPLRRRWALQALVPLLPVAVMVVLGPLLAGAPPPDVVDVLFVVAAYAVLLGLPVYQLLTQRPAVVVDLEGIRYGRRRFLPWDAVGGLGVVIGLPLGRTFLVIRRDRSGKNIRLSQRNVRDLPEFRRWLETVLTDQRRTPTSHNG